MLKKRTGLVLSVLIFFAGLAAATFAADEMVIGYVQIEPHIYKEAGQETPQGAAVEYWEKSLAPQMDVTITWKGPMTFDRLLESLKTGEVHAGLILAKNPDREKILWYPTLPFYLSQPAIVVMKERELQEIHAIDQLLGMRIGFVTQSYLSPLMKDERLQWDLVTQTNWQEANLKKLLVKRIDAAYFPESNTAFYYINKLQLQEQLKVVVLPEQPIAFYTAFSQQTGSDLFHRYEQARATIEARSPYATILERYNSKAR